ncbi:MAG: hypothetical protein ACTS41_01435 [Candidatus Hodgkinia cicadicola]
MIKERGKPKQPNNPNAPSGSWVEGVPTYSAVPVIVRCSATTAEVRGREKALKRPPTIRSQSY